MSKSGKIIPHGVKLEAHEYNTILFLTMLGKDIELIPPSHTPNSHNADFFMDGLIWEAKSPIGKSSRMTIERILHKAAKQSENIILDLRRTYLSEKESLNRIRKYFHSSSRIKHLLIITKQEKLVDLKK